MFCFHLQKNELNKGIYFSILTKNLSVINIPKQTLIFGLMKKLKIIHILLMRKKTTGK